MSQAPAAVDIEQEIEDAKAELRKKLDLCNQTSKAVVDEAEKLARSARRASSAGLQAVRPDPKPNKPEASLTGKFAAIRGA